MVAGVTTISGFWILMADSGTVHGRWETSSLSTPARSICCILLHRRHTCKFLLPPSAFFLTESWPPAPKKPRSTSTKLQKFQLSIILVPLASSPRSQTCLSFWNLPTTKIRYPSTECTRSDKNGGYQKHRHHWRVMQ